jgi:hypothetical protein
LHRLCPELEETGIGIVGLLHRLAVSSFPAQKLSISFRCAESLVTNHFGLMAKCWWSDHPGRRHRNVQPRPPTAVVTEAPVHLPQTVHDIAAGDHEHTTLSQWSQVGAQVAVVVERLVSIDRQLDNRNGRVRNACTSTDHVP